MNNESMMNLFNTDNTMNNTFDFSKNWNNDKFINVDDDDEIIIGAKNDDSDFLFDNSFDEEDSVLNIANDTSNVSLEDNVSTGSTELDSFFDSIYNGVEDANNLISQINLKNKLIEKEQNFLSIWILKDKH